MTASKDWCAGDPYTYGGEYLGYIYDVIEAKCALMRAEYALNESLSRLRVAAKNGITDSHKRVMLDLFIGEDTVEQPAKILQDLEGQGLISQTENPEGAVSYKLTSNGVDLYYAL